MKDGFNRTSGELREVLFHQSVKYLMPGANNGWYLVLKVPGAWYPRCPVPEVPGGVVPGGWRCPRCPEVTCPAPEAPEMPGDELPGARGARW